MTHNPKMKHCGVLPEYANLHGHSGHKWNDELDGEEFWCPGGAAKPEPRLPDPGQPQEGGWSLAIPTTGETVNHPDHYGGDTVYEAIKVIEAWGLGFHLGNAVKYISRAGKKDKKKEIEDLRKAAWYIDRRLELLEGKSNDNSA